MQTPLAQTLRRTAETLMPYQAPIRFFGLALVAGLAYLAHQSFEAKEAMAGFVRIIAATVLLVLVARPMPVLNKVEVEERPQLAGRRRRGFGLAWLVASGVMLWLAFQIFYSLRPGEVPDRTPWEYFTFGMMMLILAGWMLTQGIVTPRPTHLWHFMLLLGIISLALFLRLYLFDEMPFGLWYDEALNGLEARQMLHQPDYRPIFIINMTQPHLWLYKTALSLFGDTNAQALRVTSVFFGVGTVIAGYKVGTLLRGPWFGLLMAFFLAIMRWSINFSRIAMTGIETGFFTLLAFYFLVRLVRYGRWRDAVWLGLVAGAGLWFYSAFRFMGGALLVYALLKTRFWQPRTILLGVIAGSVVVITVLPLLTFIQINPDTYFARSRQTSILRAENRLIPDLQDALEHTLEKHLQMFHIEGDINGRHNLPREPMLDPVMGILMVLGIGLAVRNFRQAEEWFFILVLVLGLLPGILTYDFEAPQALRTIGVLPAVAYFCALATLTLAQIFMQHRYSKPLVAGIVGLLAFSLVSNSQTYFDKQRHNYNVWADFSSISATVAQVASERSAETRLYLSPLVDLEPNAHFTAPELANRPQPLTLPDIFPLRLEAKAPATVFLDVNDTWLLDYAHQIYPDATYRTVYSGDYGVSPSVPIFYVIDLSIEDLASVQGVGEDGTGVLYIPQYGEYRLSVPRGATLMLDHQPVESEAETLFLAVGNHAIQISPPELSQIEWRRPNDFSFSNVPRHYLYHDPVRAEGLLARFYANAAWEDLPVLQRIDPALDMYFHHLPMERPYSVIWSGWLRIDADGVYGFSLRAVEWAELRVNETIALTTQGYPYAAVTTQLQLTRGAYHVEVRYRDTVAFSRIHLLWMPPGQVTFTTLPPSVLSPTSNLIEQIAP